MPTRLSARQTRATIARLRIERPLLAAFAVADGARHVRYAMHSHSRHQLLLASAGSFWVETREQLHVCDASSGLWIPARCRHATTMSAHATVSLFLSPSRYPTPTRHATPVATTPLLLQMAAAAAGEVRQLAAPTRRKFFDVLYALAASQVRPSASPTLPNPTDPSLAAAVEYLLTHLEKANVSHMARAAALSERTLRRRCIAELRLTPEQYIRRARLLRAAQLLQSDPRARVLEIAEQVGYTSQSAFTAAFRQMFGISPRAARRGGPPTEVSSRQ